MDSKKVTFKSSEKTFTLMDDYFIIGEHSDEIIKMKMLDVSILPTKFEDIVKSNEFCIVFPDYFYHGGKWFLLEKKYPETKIAILATENNENNYKFDLNLDHILYSVIKKEGWRKSFPREFTLLLPTSKNTSSLSKNSTKGIIYSHVLSGKLTLGNDPTEMTTLSESKLKYDPEKKTISGSKIQNIITGEDYVVYLIDQYLPIEEPKKYSQDDTYLNEEFLNAINSYFKKKIELSKNNINKVINILDSETKNLFYISMLDSESAQLLRLAYSLKNI